MCESHRSGTLVSSTKVPIISFAASGLSADTQLNTLERTGTPTVGAGATMFSQTPLVVLPTPTKAGISSLHSTFSPVFRLAPCVTARFSFPNEGWG
jgi:hypothetical protein